MADVSRQALEFNTGARANTVAPNWPGLFTGVGLIVVFVAVGLGAPAFLPVQAASWLTFVALVITPGYLLGEMLTWRLDLDLLERLALAMPLGVFVMALPGLVTMLAHMTIADLKIGWTLTVGSLIVVWLIHQLLVRKPASRSLCPPWSWDEVAMVALLLAAFVYMVPTLTLYKMDGDAYAVATFTADALTGRPLNAVEPVLGTGQSVGTIRMGLNQMLPVLHLWSYLSGIDHVELAGTASRSMLALWAILATYMLGKAAGNGSRRVGLLTAAIQTLVYLAAPFLRADHVGIFFFERTNADKFTVTVTMLPVTLALAIRFVRTGRREAWIAAAMSGFAVSSVHALIAAMLALALGAFGGLHLLLHLRRRDAWIHVGGLALLVAIVMVLPLIQLVEARSGEAMAPTYPSTFEGWSVEKRAIPVLPFLQMETWDIYGPLPDLTRLRAEQANMPTNPFLIWRFALNMRRQRIIVFDLKRYISDPTIILEPVYLVALVLLPLLLWRLRSDLGAQFALSTSLAVLFVLYNPFLTPILGSLVMPWILWRFVWLLPYALIIALATDQLVAASVSILVRGFRLPSLRPLLLGCATLAFVLLAAILLRGSILTNIEEMHARGAGSFVYATPQEIMARLQEETAQDGPVMVMADENLSVTIPAFVGNADIVAHRILSTSEMFPADQQDLALQRHIDQASFFNTRLLTPRHIDILKRYDIRYMVVPGGTSLDAQLQVSPQWFEWLATDQGYSLYAVRTGQLPTPTESLEGNAAFTEHRWEEAEQHYRSALERDPADMLALLGLADIYRIGGQFDQALDSLGKALAEREAPIIHYRLGQVYTDMGQVERSIAEFDLAERGAPAILSFHMALGDACLGAGDSACAAAQFERAVGTLELADEAQRLSALAGIWQQRAHEDLALPLYERVAAIRPNEQTRLALADLYRRTEQFDKAEQVLEAVRQEFPLSVDPVSAMARLRADEGTIDQSIFLYRRAIWMQALLAQDARLTHLALAQTLLDAGLPDGARKEIEHILTLQPHNALAYVLLGNLYRAQYEPNKAMEAYQYALQVDPTQAAAYTSLSDQQRQLAIRPDETVALMQRAVEFNPEQTFLALTLADQFRRLGDIDTAITMYQQALGWFEPNELSLSAGPQPTGRTRALTYSRLAALYEDLGQVEPAMNYYHAAVTAAPDEPWPLVTLGDALRRRNQIEAAEASYRAALDKDPALAEPYLHLASLLSDRGDAAAALTLYEQAVQAAQAGSSTTQLSRAWLALGTFYGQSPDADPPFGSDEEPILEAAAGDPVSEKALAAHYRALEAEESAAGVRALARLLEDLNRTGEAIALYKDRIQRGEQEKWVPTQLAQYYVGLGEAQLAEGQRDEAITAFRRAVDLDGWWPTARLALARGLSEQGDQAGALAETKKAAEIAPGSIEARIALANAIEQRGDREQALTIYQATAEAHPGSVPANLALARAWQNQNRWELAEGSYRQAISMVPGDTEAYLGLATLKASRARFEEAEALLGEALRIDRSNGPIYLRLGDLLARQARHAEALDAYREAALFGRDDWSAYAGLAGVHQALGEIDRAEDSLRNAVATDGAPSSPFLQLASFYQEQNLPDRAEQTLLAALERLPGDPAIRQALAEFYQSMARSDEALQQLQLGVGENPDSVALLVSYANLLSLLGHDEESASVYQQAEQAGTPDGAGYQALAAALRAQGRNAEALALLDRALASGPPDVGYWIQKGQTEMQLGRPEAAFASLEQATELAPAEGRTWHGLGNALLTARRYQEAAVALEQAIAVEPTYLPAYGSLVEAYQQLGQREPTVEAVTQAKAVAPGSPLSHLADARVLTNLQKWDAARAALNQAIARAPGIPQSYSTMAQLEQEQGNSQAAADWYRQAISLQPGDQTAYRGLIDLLLAEADNTGALKEIHRSLEIRPGDGELLLRLGRVQRILGKTAEAQSTLLHAARLNPADDIIQAELGLLYQAQGKPEEAIAAYSAAIALRPDQATHYLALSQILSAQGRPEQALLTLQNALPQASRPVPLYVAMATLYRRQGEPGLALEILKQGSEEFGQDVQLELALATHYQSLADFDRAAQVVRYTVEQHPEDAAAYLASAAGHLDRGRSAEALAQFQKAEELAPTDANVVLALGNAHQLMGRTEEAIAAYLRALALAPRSEAATLALASVYRSQARWQEARAAYERGLAATPSSGLLLIEYSSFLFQRGEEEEALGLLDRAVQISANARTFLARAALYRVLGRPADAQRDLETAIRLEPGSVEASVAMGDLYRAQGKTEEALKTVQQAVVLEPGTALPHLRLAELAYGQGKLDEAWRQFEAAHKAEPASPEPVVRLAAARAEQGDWAEAETAYRQALELAPAATEAYLGLADVVQRRAQDGSLADALGWLQQAEGPGIRLGAIYRTMGEMAASAAQSGAAAEYLQKAVELEPAAPDGYLSLANLALAEGRAKDAEGYATQALEIVPRDPAPHIALGNIYYALGEPAAAEKSYQEAISLDATRVDGYTALAEFYVAQEQYPKAIAAYEEAMLKAPLDWTLWVSLGNVYVERKKYGDASAAYKRAAEMNPSVPEPLLRQGDLYVTRKKWKSAQAAFDAAATMRPKQSDPLLRLASLYEERNNLSNAKSYARQAIALDPASAGGYLVLGRVQSEQGKTAEAAQAFISSIQRNPRQLAVYNRWMGSYTDIKRRPYSVDTTRLKAALAALAKSEESKALWAQVLLGLGALNLDADANAAQATVYLEEALRIDPAFGALYQELAQTYEKELKGRQALEAWYRYLYSVGRGTDPSEAQKHIDSLLNAQIEQPADGDQVSGAVKITGTAKGKSLQSYQVQVATGASPNTWSTIAQGRTRVEHGSLATWDTTVLAPGKYRLRLSVVDTKGKTGPYYEITVNVQASP